MQSKPKLDIEVRVFLLVGLLFLAGATLPLDHLRAVANQPYQGGTYLFLTLIIDLLQQKHSIQTFLNHPKEVSSLLTFFSSPENYNESYWWLQHRPQLLKLFADETTFLLLAHSPWLFQPLHILINYSPQEFQKAISNRTFFNDLLALATDQPELRTILSTSPIVMVAVIEEPSLLPYIRAILNNQQIKQILLQNQFLFPYFLANPTLNLPNTLEWVLILQPANKAIINRPTNILVLIRTDYPLNQTSIVLIQNRTSIKTLPGSLRPLNGSTGYLNTGPFLYNATLTPTNATIGRYYLQANVTRFNTANLTTQITITLISSTAQPTTSLLNMQATQHSLAVSLIAKPASNPRRAIWWINAE